MSRMSWQTSRRGTPASVAAFRARPSAVSLKSTPVTWKPRRASSIEWRPNPHGASRIRAPASSAATPTIHSTSLAASVGDANACEIWGQASRKNRSLWNTAAIVAGTARAVYSVGGLRRGATRRCCIGDREGGLLRGWPEPGATRRCCNGVRVLGASRGWPEPGATRRCCSGDRVLGASRGWPEPGATRLHAACDIFRLMATLVTGAFGCIGSSVLRGLFAAGGRPLVFGGGGDPWRPPVVAGGDVAPPVTVLGGDNPGRDAPGPVPRPRAGLGGAPRGLPGGSPPPRAPRPRAPARPPPPPRPPLGRPPRGAALQGWGGAGAPPSSPGRSPRPPSRARGPPASPAPASTTS